MNKFLVLGALTALVGCSAGGDSGGKDSGTTGNTGPGAFEMTDFSGTCASNTCTYTITTMNESGFQSVDMTETDDSYLYNEYHDGFGLDSDNGDGTYTYSLSLGAVSTPTDVVSNQTTLFYEDTVLDGTTWWFYAESKDGSESDCVVTGDDPTYYSAECTNVE